MRQLGIIKLTSRMRQINTILNVKNSILQYRVKVSALALENDKIYQGIARGTNSIKFYTLEII